MLLYGLATNIHTEDKLSQKNIFLYFRIQIAEKTYKDSFDDELEQFKERIKRRAAEKIQDALKEQEEEEKKARLGPGGLDPVEVYEELPDVRSQNT